MQACGSSRGVWAQPLLASLRQGARRVIRTRASAASAGKPSGTPSAAQREAPDEAAAARQDAVLAGAAAVPAAAPAEAEAAAGAAAVEAAAEAAGAAAGGGDGSGSGSGSEEEVLDLPLSEHIILQPNFLAVAPQIREHFDQRVGSPLKTTSDRFVWDHWHVPGQYNLLRTPANAFFPPRLYDKLEDGLIEYGEKALGCRGISPIWLSYYVNGHRQGWHTDAPHGPFAFVLSLTRWEERRFSGGETMLLQPWVLDYWRHFDPSRGNEVPQLMTLVPPLFNQLTVFDGRLPHAVQQVEGTHDPLEARIVLHGWFTQPAPFFAGSLSEEEATPALNACLDGLYAALAALPPAVGVVTLRLEVDPSGKPADIVWLANTLVARPQAGEEPQDVCDATLACIAEHVFEARFPASSDGGATAVTLPFVFE